MGLKESRQKLAKKIQLMKKERKLQEMARFRSIDIKN